MGFFKRRSGVIILLLIVLIATADAATGTITINVNPGGGMVCLGTICKENPTTNDGSGTTVFSNADVDCYHMLNIYGLDGYKPYLKQIYVDSTSSSQTRTITLEPLPATAPETASVTVFVNPDGGRVCLNRMCEVSTGDGSGSWSVQFASIEANKHHTLTAAKEGYETWTDEIRLIPGEKRKLAVTLSPLPEGSVTATLSSPDPTPSPAPEPTRAPLFSASALIAILLLGCGAWCVRWYRR